MIVTLDGAVSHWLVSVRRFEFPFAFAIAHVDALKEFHHLHLTVEPDTEVLLC